MSLDLTNAERETHVSQTADDRSQWEMYTDDPVWIARMEKLGIEPTRQTSTGVFYTVPDAQVSIRKARKPLTEAQRAKLSKRMARLRSAQNNQRETGKQGM